MKTWPWVLRTVVALSLVSAGCANVTPQALREEKTDVLTFDVAQPYQDVYRTLLAQSRACYAGGQLGGTIAVEGDLYPDIASGEVIVNFYRWGSTVALITMDVSALPMEHSRVTVYGYSGYWRGRGRAVESWVTMGATAC